MNKINVVKVKFKGNPKPYYFKNKIPNIEIGQTIIVDTKNGLALASIEEFLDFNKFQPGHPTRATYGTIDKYSDN